LRISAVEKGAAMRVDVLLDELRQVGRDVVEGERQLAEQEALLVALKREGKDVSKVKAALDQMREDHRLRQQDRERLLSRLQP
jgi:anthranilate phosphoribosyltransferase